MISPGGRRCPATRGPCASPRSVSRLVADLGAAQADVGGVATATFDELVDPFVVPPDAGLVSADGTTVQIVGRVPGDGDWNWWLPRRLGWLPQITIEGAESERG